MAKQAVYTDYYDTYTLNPRAGSEFSKMRGVTDFTNAKQLNMYESGHSLLVIVDKPVFIEKCADNDEEFRKVADAFYNILEWEFKGLTGIEDISVDTLEYTDGVSTINAAGKANKQSATEVTMSFTEKSGSTITRFIKYYIEGVRDPRSQMKTYHGLIANGELAAGFENEVFNLLYLVTDNTGLGLEAAYYLANAWPNNARTSIYESDKATIESKQIDVTFQCFPIDGPEIEKRALKMLAYINKTGAVQNAASARLDNRTASLVQGVNTDPEPVEWNSDYHQWAALKNIESRYGQSSETR